MATTPRKKPANLDTYRKQRAEKTQAAVTRRQLSEAAERLTILEAEMALQRELVDARPLDPITVTTGDDDSEACAVAVATDWHIGSMVRPEQVNGLNHYNVEIASQRARQFFERIVRLTNKERQDVTINNLLLLLNGDLIDGALHLDTIMSDEVSEVFNQAVIAQELIAAGLEYLEKEGGFTNITIVCSDGNHGRITTKLHHGSRKGNSAEWYMYYVLAARYPQFNWVLEQGLLTYVKVFDWTVRCLHGDPIHFGGVNGPHTYLKRRIYQWDTSRRADVTILGHLHTYLPTRRYVISGSLVGYNPFAVSLGAEYEPPIQAFFLLDKKRGVSVHIPMLFDQ